MSSSFESLEKHFPSKYDARPVQTDIMHKIDDAIKSGYRDIILCAPTGIGKSHIAMAFAMALGSSHTLTAQKILQDQYRADFSWTYSMKGKSNFPCIDLYDHDSIPYEDARKDDLVACTHGNCSWQEDGEGGKKKTSFCKYKPSTDQFMVNARGTEQETVEPLTQDATCYYYDQKYKALNASHSVFNYSAYFLTRTYSTGIKHLLERKCIIADEAHEIEDQIIDMMGMDIRRMHLTDVGLDMSDYSTGDVDGVKNMVEHVANVYQQFIQQMDSSNDKKLTLYKRRRDHLDSIHTDLANTPDNMIIQPIDGGGVSVKPIEIGEYAKKFFDMKHNLYMSATIHRDVFCETMGLDPEKCAYVEIEQSPFPRENRQVHFLNVRKLSVRSDDSDYAAMYSQVAEIMKKHAGQKGLILTTRKDHCTNLAEHMRSTDDAEASRIKIVHNDSGEERDVALRNHATTDEPQVLTSPSLWYGVNLKDDLSRFQVIVKTPYLSLADARTKIKQRKSQRWYLYASLTKLLQGLGRSVRSYDDHAETYILDSSAQDLLRRMHKFVPKSYADVLNL